MQNIIILAQSILTFIVILYIIESIRIHKVKLTLNNIPILLILYTIYLISLLFSVYYIVNYIILGFVLSLLVFILLSFTQVKMKMRDNILYLFLITLFWAQLLLAFVYTILFTKPDFDDAHEP
jgi:hypothetical protein